MGGEGEESGEAQAFMMGARPLERSLADLPSKMDAPPMSPATAAPPSDAAADASAGRSAPEILKGGLANLSENPFGWLFGKPSPLYSTEPSADRLQWEGDKAPAASPPSPPPPSTRVSEYAAYTTPDAAPAAATKKSRKKKKGKGMPRAPAPAPAAAPRPAPAPAPV